MFAGNFNIGFLGMTQEQAHGTGGLWLTEGCAQTRGWGS